MSRTRTLLRGALAATGLALAAHAAAFDLQGHRGARGLAPENTLAAFARALAIGVTTLELDAGVTRDGVVVVSHDAALHPDLTRGADGQWLAAKGPLIHATPYTELARYDVGRLKAGSRTAQRFPQQAPADGERIPRLAEVFALAARAQNAALRFNVETKIDPRRPDDTLAPEAFARALIAEVKKAGVEARTTIQSFDWRTLAVVQREAPGIATVYLTARQRWLDNVADGPAGPSAWTGGVSLAAQGSVPRMVKAAGGRIWSPFFGDLDAAQRDEAKALGLAVVVWTVNETADIARMLDLGVDGIISDYPDRVRAEMGKRGMALPAATPVAP